ncbi:hypothetical protein D3C87_1710610 [compost metagenome]
MNRVEETPQFSFGGLALMGNFSYFENQWHLLDFDDADLPEQSATEMRFEISNDFQNLKKALAE